MSDGPEWFAPKRYGYGSGPPISWQGWVLTIAFVVGVAVLALFLARRPVILSAILVPVTVTFGTIAARTTKGGWRWRWADKD
jgi:hypothetical protein